MAGLFQVTRPSPNPANAIVLVTDKERGLLMILNPVFDGVGHTIKPLLETERFLVKYGKKRWKLHEPVTG